MFTKYRLDAAITLTLLSTGCKLTDVSHFPQHNPEWLAQQPDSYFENLAYNVGYMTKQQNAEWTKRKFAKRRETDRRAACVFGSNSVIDRKKLNCHNVKGAPEYVEPKLGDTSSGPIQ